jgi:DNA polymerase III subunit chi
VTEVAFHFGAPNKLEYAGRLLRKAVGRGARMVVFGSDGLVRRLDALLWAQSPTEFLAHCVDGDPSMLRSPVVLASALHPGLPTGSVLLNLADVVPEGFDRFGRVIEVVSHDEEDRLAARGRWKQYAQRGITIQKHDLNLKGAA